MSRDFDIEYPDEFESELFDYLSISQTEFPTASKAFECPIMDKKYFTELTNQYRSPHIWKLNDSGWSLRHAV